MKIRALVSLFLLVAPGAAFALPSESLRAKVDAYLAPYVAAKDFAGTVLLAKGGKVLLRKGYGLANQELGVPNHPETRFQIGSVTKTFTAAAVVLLDRQGLLHLDDPLSKYIPGFPRGGEIRISHLLGHSSGIPDMYSLPEYEEMKTRHVAITDLIALLETKPLDFAPGTSSSYSNSGYALLAYIVERVSGRTYQDFLRERIFAPLHLDHTGFWERQPILPGRAAGYEPWLPPAGVINTPYYDESILFGSGDLYSTVDDLYAWYQAIREGRLFRLDSLREPYGWGPRKRFGRDEVEQDGADPGFVAHLGAYLKDDACVVVLGNIRTAAIDRIKVDLEGLVFGEKVEPPAPRKTVKVDPGAFDAYVGSYEAGPKMILTVERRGGNLFLKGTGGIFLPLEPLSESRFFYRQLYVPLVFDRGPDGKVSQVLWDGKYPCKKVQ
ncbi:MAG TPA: serine hydrolase [Thermoanaerobaculia bacterium]|jgi:CubicO group peptidase (beta-lactamase class C family)